MKEEELEKEISNLESPEGSNEKPKKKKGSVIKYILYIAFVLLATGLALFLSLFQNFNTVIGYLATSDWRWILAIVGILLGCMVIKGLIYYCFARLYTRSYRLHRGIAIDQIGVFYNAVTPGSSGGQIMQAYTFKKQGVPISSAVSIMAMYSILYQIVLILYGLASFIFKFDFIISLWNTSLFNLGQINLSIGFLTILGFVLNISVILIVLMMGYWRGFHNWIMGPVISFLAKIKIIKNPDKKREDLRVQVENFKVEFRRLWTNVPFTILVIILLFAYLTFRFSIPYFVGLALGNESGAASFWDAIFLSNYHQMVTGLIPIPGSSGVSELFFYKLFQSTNNPVTGFYYMSAHDGLSAEAATDALCRASLVVWRSITFAIPLLIAGFVTAFYKASPHDQIRQRGDIPDRKTLTALQAETLAERNLEVETIIETQSITRAAVLKKLKERSPQNRRKQKEEASDKFIDREDNIDVNFDSYDEDDEDY